MTPSEPKARIEPHDSARTPSSATKRGMLKALLGVGAAAASAAAIQPAQAFSIGAQPPRRLGGKKEDARWGMLIDIRKCIGCQACTVACSAENVPPLGQFRTTVLQYEVDSPQPEAAPTMLPLPRLCNHCDDPPCVPVCPVQATFQRTDGIVLVDNERCVGCGYCVQACPYDARFLNHETQTADKCTFCHHRVDVGLLPACVESCVGGARVFGDLNDIDSEINRQLEANDGDIKVLKPSQKTKPRVFYVGLPDEFVNGVDGQPSVRLVSEV